MLKFEKDGKKVMEMKDNGKVEVYEKNLEGAGELKETKKEKDENKDDE